MIEESNRSASPIKLPDWSEVAREYSVALERYFDEKGVDPNSSGTRSTIEINSTLVPKRGDNLVHWLEERAGIGEIRGKRVLELGCGFGALSAYLALGRGASQVLAIDINNDFLAIARACAQRLRYQDVVHFEHADMRSLVGLSDQPFDIVIANNALLYITSRKGVSEVLADAYAVLQPDGAIVVHQANKWQWREPFTKDPIVHMLPTPLARGVSKLTGWQHNHGRVRLLSPLELRRRLRRAGFRDVRLNGVGVATHGLKRFASHFIVGTGKRPESRSVVRP